MAKTALIVVDMLNHREQLIKSALDGARPDLVEPLVARDEDLADASLRMMERTMHAEVCAAGECRMGERH